MYDKITVNQKRFRKRRKTPWKCRVFFGAAETQANRKQVSKKENEIEIENEIETETECECNSSEREGAAAAACVGV